MENKKIYICLTNLCQLCCNGCYMNSSQNLEKEYINLDFVRSIINEMLQQNNIELECVFHGGEPFYNREDAYLQSIIDLIKEYPNIKWSATTNLVYEITPRLLELFTLFNNKFIKTSWDIENYRFKNITQLQQWENNTKYLLKEGFDILTIITVNNVLIQHNPIEIFEYFKSIGIKNINFERITEEGRALINKVRPTNIQVNKWLYSAYLYNKINKDFQIPMFSELEGIVKGGQPLGCRLRNCMKNVITLNSNNTIATCPNISNKIIGNENSYNHEYHQLLINSEKKVNDKCLACRYYTVCKGECSQLIWDETGCPGLKDILKDLMQ